MVINVLKNGSIADSMKHIKVTRKDKPEIYELLKRK